MATYRLMCWQDIPVAVEATAGGKTHKRPLSPRFQDLVDRLAMRQGLSGTDAYLEQWRKTETRERDGSAEEVAAAVAAELEAAFEQLRADALAAGREKKA